AATRLTLARLVDGETATIQLRIVHCVDGLIGRLRVRESHEAEATRTSSLPIRHHVGVLYITISLEGSAQTRAIRAPAEAAHKYTFTHFSLFSSAPEWPAAESATSTQRCRTLSILLLSSAVGEGSCVDFTDGCTIGSLFLTMCA